MTGVATRNASASLTLSPDEDRWAAVIRRDRNADGRFYYSVRTTGVYCRPSCASRLARRENVHFHTNARRRRRLASGRANGVGRTRQRSPIRVPPAWLRPVG
jgi:hypothetical protein